MEPKSPENSAEQLPTPIEFTPISPEVGKTQLEPSPERPVSSPERGQELHNATTVAAPMQPVQVAVPTIPTPPPANDTTAVASDDTPVTAADEDLIEKEWVDKAKHIISTTKQDPYKQERQVGQLQADYLRKRYGKELGSSS